MLTFSGSLIAVVLAAQSPPAPVIPESCSVTRPPEKPFVPKTPATNEWPGMFRIGTDDLWTWIRADGTWGYQTSSKFFWWREGYLARDENFPELKITARRLDGPAPVAVSGRTTNAMGEDIGQSMLTSIPIPTSGCWQVTGTYHGHEVTFVTWVASGAVQKGI